MNNWFIRVFKSFDKFLNALTWGNPECTISSRCGYYAHIRRDWLFKIFAQIIDWSFSPVMDDHTWKSYYKNKGKYNHSGYLPLLLLGIIILVSCPVIFMSLWGFNKVTKKRIDL